MTLSNQRITSTMMITPTIPTPPFRFMVFSFSMDGFAGPGVRAHSSHTPADYIGRSGVTFGLPCGPSGCRPARRTSSPRFPSFSPASSPAFPTWSLTSVPSMPRAVFLRSVLTVRYVRLTWSIEPAPSSSSRRLWALHFVGDDHGRVLRLLVDCAARGAGGRADRAADDGSDGPADDSAGDGACGTAQEGTTGLFVAMGNARLVVLAERLASLGSVGGDGLGLDDALGHGWISWRGCEPVNADRQPQSAVAGPPRHDEPSSRRCCAARDLEPADGGRRHAALRGRFRRRGAAGAAAIPWATPLPSCGQPPRAREWQGGCSNPGIPSGGPARSCRSRSDRPRSRRSPDRAGHARARRRAPSGTARDRTPAL